MRLGIFGGTFDPVHYGHLLLAESCREQCRLDEVWFLPAAIPPHKQSQVITSAEQRIEMLELAIAGHESFRVSRYEIDRGGVSYTVRTLEGLKEEDPGRELFFLMGADSLRDLPNWFQPERICQLARLVVVRRAGQGEPDFSSLAGIVSAERLLEIQSLQVEMPLVDFSSRNLRERVAGGQGIRYRTPRAVEKFIETAGLYRVQ